VPVEAGIVALSNYTRPSLESPAVSWSGRSIYFAFGLEGVNDNTGYFPREELLAKALIFSIDEPTATISTTVRPVFQQTVFAVSMENSLGGDATMLRWDFGDGTPYTDWYPVKAPADPSYPPLNAGHVYKRPGTYTVRVQAANGMGTTVIGQAPITVPDMATGDYIDRWYHNFLPSVGKHATW
jgi:hypothetical protein